MFFSIVLPVYSQLGEGLGTEVVRQELEEANESDEYQKVDTNETTQNDSIKAIDNQPDEQTDQIVKKENLSEESPNESSTRTYIILVILGLLAIFAVYRYKISQDK